MQTDSGVIQLGWLELLPAFLLVLIPLILFRGIGLRLEKTLLIGLARMILQLAGLGLVLEVLFRWNEISWNILWLLVMQLSASWTILRRSGNLPRPMYWQLPILIVLSSSFVLAFALIFVVRPDPLHEAQYLIPLGGMILGNSMNGTTLALERHLSRFRTTAGQREWETLLSLGATVRDARSRIMRSSLHSALLPILNTTATLGLVSIPGMMTGQILGGSAPATAILYQMLIMLAIIAAISLSAWGGLRLLHAQLVDGSGIVKEGMMG
jgi:putative ABC transport system permease protein